MRMIFDRKAALTVVYDRNLALSYHIRRPTSVFSRRLSVTHEAQWFRCPTQGVRHSFACGRAI